MNHSSQGEQDIFQRRMGQLIRIALLIWLMAALAYLLQFSGKIEADEAIWGQFGDYMGGTLNPILTFCSLVALLFTISLQVRQLNLAQEQLENSQNELANSRRELALTRIQAERSAEALQNQNETFKLQNFESTFFQLISRFENCVDNILHAHGSKGRIAIQVFLNELNNTYTSDHKKNVDEIYLSFSTRTSQHFDVYFRTLYQIFRFIDTSALPEADKINYAKFARANLSRYELVLIYYNGAIHPEGQKDFRPLIHKYNILKHLKEGDLVMPVGEATGYHKNNRPKQQTTTNSR